MAGYRQVHTQFWKDEYIIELEPLERYLYLYFFTNELSSISGIYKLPLKVIVNETGLEKVFVQEAIAKFQNDKKIAYGDSVVWVVNMEKYHHNASDRTQKKVTADVDLISDCGVKRMYLYHKETGIYSIDTVSIPCTQRESKKEIESEKPSPDGEKVEDDLRTADDIRRGIAERAAAKAQADQFKPAQVADVFEKWPVDVIDFCREFSRIRGIKPTVSQKTDWIQGARECIGLNMRPPDINGVVHWMVDKERDCPRPGSLIKAWQEISAKKPAQPAQQERPVQRRA